MRSYTRKSIVWNYFEMRQDKQSVMCNICKKQYKYYGNTTNLKEHLKRLHPAALVKKEDQSAKKSTTQGYAEKCTTPATAASSSSNLNRIKNKPAETSICTTNVKRARQSVEDSAEVILITEEYRQLLDNLVVKLVVTDFQPLSIVEDRGFKELVANLNPNYSLPSKKTLSKQLLPQCYYKLYAGLIEKLHSQDHMSITTDYWTSNTEKAYISVTAHFIQDWKLHAITLAIREVSVSNNSEDTGAVLKDILDEVGVFDKVVTIVTNNAENMKQAVLNDLNKHHHPCVAHTVNLCVNDALDSIKGLSPILTKCRLLVGHFKLCTLSYRKLHQKQEEMGLQALGLKREVPTLWNSTYLMMERLLRLKQPLSIVLAELTLESAPNNLSGSEWAIVTDCVVALKPFITITEELASEKYVTMSKIVPLIKGLQFTLRLVSVDTFVGEQLKESLLDAISNRLGYLEVNKMVAKATILDPRFKTAGFGIDSNARTAQDWLTEELAIILENKTEDAPEVIELTEDMVETKPQIVDEGNLWLHFDQKVANASSVEEPNSMSAIMVKQYFETKLLPRKDDPLMYWKDHERFFPELANLAKKYLSIPATSIPAERLFSKSGYMLNERRSRLPSKNLNEILFLNANM
uniref:BED-type domain-containing protein n=1 Tax=Dendroctonus ponderosae TaxID=77166 RepID=A0AAR5PTC4_DENPD